MGNHRFLCAQVRERSPRVPFRIGYWSFIFSARLSATYGIHWLQVTQPADWAFWSWLIGDDEEPRTIERLRQGGELLHKRS